ncbi:flavodoxin family protein [Mycoplasmatota bacterium]|nr:flavodoxin family protein [Mycoplasmatota bacterium]
MKTIVIRECSDLEVNSIYEMDLRNFNPKDCKGCWNCWIKTPGKCVHKDLNDFYRFYLEADKVIIFSEVKNGFISGKIKTLLDRLIPHFLPYMDVSGDGFNHQPRYDKYPDIEFYYQGDFHSEKGREILKDYIIRTFTQFRSKKVSFKKIKDYRGEKYENTNY